MQIYFTASVHGKKTFLGDYQRIVGYLEKTGYRVISSIDLETDSKSIVIEDDEEKVAFYKKVLSWINKSDLVVAEISYPSINVGHEISLGLEKGKPVIALYRGQQEPHLLQGLISDKLIILNYKGSNLEKALKEALEDAKEQMDVRFNFFISPKIGVYLDWISKNRKLPRAVFLRKLIEEDLKKNKDFKGK